MTSHLSLPGAARRPGASRPALAPTFRTTLRVAVARGAALARATGAIVVSAGDGLLVGLVTGFVAATTLSGPEKHLGLPWLVESAIAGGGAAAIVLAGAGAALAARGFVMLAGRLLDVVLRRISAHWRGAGRLHVIAKLPGRLLRALPVGWLGALAGALLLANAETRVGPLGLFVPSGALGGYVVLAGVAAAFGNAARHAGHGWPLAAARPTDGRVPRVRRVAAAVLGLGAVFVAGYGGSVLVLPQAPAPAVAPDAAFDGQLGPTALGDPGAPGPFAVRELSYGSGTDRLRPAFGEGVDLRTPTVDASGVLAPLGWGADEAREWFWGFGTDALPLNGIAWLPEGDGPFPLVLIVHGNHAMGDFSEPGYAYLGRHLASRGFITVSVDENFLNGSWASDWGGSEQLARAWLLLLHVDQWRTWNGDAASPLHGLVDLDRVALMGHSRGGEAATVAASLAGRASPPAQNVAPWPAGIRIRAVVAISPSDSQYAGGSVILDGIDYLTIHGGHDGDATSWMGIRQYARTIVGRGGFKAALWAYRANHGQFNTTWGRSDQGDLGGAILNLDPIQDAADQEDVARTAIGAFLEASLHGQTGYRDLFRRPMVGRAWLPADDVYLVRSMDDRYVPLLTGDGGRGVEGVAMAAVGFESAVARAVPLRSLLPDQRTRALELRWTAASSWATWTVDGLPAAGAHGAQAVRLSLANGAAPTDGAGPRDLLVELTTGGGVRVALPLSRWGVLPPPLSVTLVKDELIASLSSMDVARGALPERVLQTYELPFADYAAADPRFDPADVATIRLIIDRAVPGSLWVAEVGLVEGA